MDTSAAGKRKLRRRAQKRPLTEDEENGGSTSAKKRASYDPKASSASTEVDKKSRKTKRKVSTRGNKKVCLEENDVEVTKENAQGLQKMPNDKEKHKIEHDTDINKGFESTESILLSDRSSETKEEVENQTLDNHKSSSSVRKATETTLSSTEQAKYVPKFGKKTKRNQAWMQTKEEHLDNTTNVETVQILSTEDSDVMQKQEDITTVAISTVVNEEKKTISEDVVAIATTEVDTVETVSSATTVETVQILSADNRSLGQKQEDITATSTVVDEEKKTVSEDEVVTATTEADTVKTLSTEGTNLTNSPVQKQEDITTTSTVVDEEKKTVSEDEVLTATTEIDTVKTSLTNSLVQKQEGITTTSTIEVASEEQNTVSEDEVVIVSIEFDTMEALSTELKEGTSLTNSLDQEQKNKVSTGKIIDEDNSVTENNISGDVNTGDTANQHTSGGTVVSSTIQPKSDSEPETVATIKSQQQDEIGTAKEATFSDNPAPQNSKPRTVEERDGSVSAPLTDPDNKSNTAEEKVVKTEHEDAPSCEMTSVPVVEVARDVLSTIIEKIVSEEAVVCGRNDSATLEVTVSPKSQGMEESSEGRPGIDSDEKKVGRKDDGPNTSASDAQEATRVTLSTESQGKDGGSKGEDCIQKNSSQKDDGSPDRSASDAQERKERSTCREGTKQQVTGNEQKDSSHTNKTLETSTTEHSDQEDSQGLDNFMDTLSSSQLYQMELEALTTAQQINAAAAKQEPDEGARKAILRLTSDLSSLNRSVMSVWREFNALQKKRLARKKEQAAKASRGPNAFCTDTATSKPVQNGREGGIICTQVAQQNPSPMKIRNDIKVAFSHLDQQKKMDQHNIIRPMSLKATNNWQQGSSSRGHVAQQNPSPMKIRNDKRVAFSHLDQQKKMDQHNIRPKSSQATNNGQRGSNSRGQVAQQNPSPMKIRNDKTVVFNNINQQKKMDQHKIRTPSLQAMKNRQQSRLLPMPKPTGRLPFQATTSQRQPQGTSGLYQNTSSSRGSQLVPPNRKPQNGSTPAKGSSSNNPFNFTPTKPAQGNSSVKMSGLQAAPSSRTGGSHNLMSCPSVNNRSFAR